MPVDLTKKKRVMVNLDKVLAMLVDEAASLDRRTAAQFLTLLIEDSLLNMPVDRFEVLWGKVEAKIESTSDPDQQKVLKDQANDLLDRLVSAGPMLPGGG